MITNSATEATLGIAIPTYNRAIHIEAQLDAILPQLRANTRLYVFDNCSTDKTAEVLGSRRHEGLIVRTSSANLGMSANISRCLVETEARWIWLLGDDDRVRSDSVQKALALLENSTAALINTVTRSSGNNREGIVTGLGQLLKVKNVTDLMHVSSNLYRKSAFLDSFKILAPSGITMAPHLAMIYHAVGRANLSVELSSAVLLDEMSSKRRYSPMELAIGLSLMPLFFPYEFQHVAAKSLKAATRWMLLWGLVAVKTKPDVSRWKLGVKMVDFNLSLHARTGLLLSNQVSLYEKARACWLATLKHAPSTLVLAAARRQQHRFDGKRDETEHELV